MRLPLRLVLIAAAVCVFNPGSASAATTIGSTLPPVPGAQFSFSNTSFSTLTDFNQTLAASSTAPGGLRAPSAGIIVRYRLETVASNGTTIFPTDQVRLRTIQDQGSLHFQMESTEPTSHSVADASEIQQFDTRMPIRAGDQLGIDATGAGSSSHVAAGAFDSGSTARQISPRLNDGTSTSGTAFINQRLLLQADIEADADGDGFGDETQDLCPTNAALQTACPTTTAAPAPLPATRRKRKCKKRKQTSAVAAKKKCRHKK